MSNWKFEDLSRHNTTKKVYNKSGKIAGNVDISNACTLEIGHRINGSGPERFGGEKEWPHVKLDVSFVSNHEPLAELFAKQLMQFVDKFFEEPDGKTDNYTR